MKKFNFLRLSMNLFVPLGLRAKKILDIKSFLDREHGDIAPSLNRSVIERDISSFSLFVRKLRGTDACVTVLQKGME